MANDWEWLGAKDYGKRLRDWYAVMDFQAGKFYFDAAHLPNVTSMETLSQLEYLLSDTAAAPTDTEIERLLAETLVPVAHLLPAMDAAILKHAQRSE